MAAFTQPMPRGSVPKVVPVMMVVGSAAALFTFINSQLNRQSNKFDRFFDQYNSAQSEASRKAAFEGAVEDPRKSFYNVLGWKPSN
ncbi:hypothetical protein BGZ61DRAFT_529141 [Ilyonectria robusta]|uniref:uncharacterized protein n=1 Tax=Ilyonectria robusta TaxID=1079257 RepID=UPI001E8D0C51|nr:uncharacterized protein BGZ61DRAFT_529141 [Ilyonectria robusta]KAH8733907.1 hypothetical protein BGZ61DRAFT_529141 [Ilyonectria robusta]